MASRSKQLMSVLTTPSKIASNLDWRKATGGAIATLDVHADRIGVRISQHPENSTKRCQYSLPVASRGRTRIPESTRQQLSELVDEHKVCGFVVSWPIQEDTGLMGAACGRTLYAIEELLKDDLGSDTKQRPVFSQSRPLCLWDADADRHQQQATCDAFGRSPVYARTSNKTEHLASKEQYHQDEAVVVSEIWDDFVRTHWPQMEQAKASSSMNSRKEGAAPMWNGEDTSSQRQLQATI